MVIKEYVTFFAEIQDHKNPAVGFRINADAILAAHAPVRKTCRRSGKFRGINVIDTDMELLKQCIYCPVLSRLPAGISGRYDFHQRVLFIIS
jgi:hypothetical protein